MARLWKIININLPFNGTVYDVRLYDEVLLPESIQQLAKECEYTIEKEKK
jgi:hypothetical protein